MPLAMSPMRSEILPRPNSSTTTRMTSSQCQIDNEPIRNSFDLERAKPEIGAHYCRNATAPQINPAQPRDGGRKARLKESDLIRAWPALTIFCVLPAN